MSHARICDAFPFGAESQYLNKSLPTDFCMGKDSKISFDGVVHRSYSHITNEPESNLEFMPGEVAVRPKIFTQIHSRQHPERSLGL